MILIVWNTIQTRITHIINAQLDGGYKSHLFTDITMFTYMVIVKCNIVILIVSKSTAKGFGLTIIKYNKQESLYHSVHHTKYGNCRIITPFPPW